MKSMFRSLRRYNYRVWFFGATISNVGTWMQSTAQAWVVLTVLTHGDAAAVGVTMALQFAPPLLLVAPAGWVADRFDRRHVLAVTQGTLMLLALTIGVLLLTGVMTLPLMYGFAAALGVAAAFDAPARQAFVSDLVGESYTANAVALNSASFNMARLIGPAFAGVLIVAVGSGWVFVLNAVSFLAMLVALAMLRVGELIRRTRAGSTGRLADGFRYAAHRSDFVVLFVIVFVLGAFGMNFQIYASTMAVDFGHDADGFGLLTSMLAIGSLTGALMTARRKEAQMRVAVGAALLFGVAQAVSALMPTFWTYAIILPVVGYSIVTMLTTANAYVQTTSDPHVRGRVLAVYVAILMGGTPIGAPIVGWVAEVWGPRAAIVVAALSGIVGFAIGAVWMLATGRVQRSDGHRFRFEITATRPIEVIEPMPEQFSDTVAETSPIALEDVGDLLDQLSEGTPPRPS